MVIGEQTRLKLLGALTLGVAILYFVPSTPFEAYAQSASGTPGAAASLSSSEVARLKQFLDKSGGYRAKDGGYYDPKAGTYADAKGGVVDNWSGYTYKDGSYKSKIGDYYDAPTRTMHLASGDTVKIPDGHSSEQVIQVLRESVEQNGGYDKAFVYRSMLEQIEKEHPPTAKSTGH